MKEIIVIALIVGLFIFFFSFLFKLFLKKNKKVEEKKVEKKPADDTSKKDVKDEIPDILKEVTTGNYMYDLSKSTKIDGIEFEENLNIDKPAEKRTNVDKAFDDIGDMGDDLDELIDIHIEEIEDLEDELLDGIEEDFHDDVLLGDIVEGDEKTGDNKLAKEYGKLSKTMKAVIIANILEKKDNK